MKDKNILFKQTLILKEPKSATDYIVIRVNA